MFVFEEVLCRWGGCKEIVTDNMPAMVAALDWLLKTYHINHIRISAYNSRTNGVVEHSHRTIRNSIVKACNWDITQWLNMCQGFTSRTPVRVRDGSLPKGLNKYPAQLPRLGQLRTCVGSKSLVMQDCKQLPWLITAPEYFGNLRREMSQVATQTFNVYITFIL